MARFRKRMYRRKKRLFRRKKRLYRRRIPRMMTSNVLYTKLTQLRSLTGSLGSQAYVVLGFNLPDLVNYNGISPFWDRVRVHKVVVNIRPKFNVIGWTINDATGAVPEIGDHGLVRTPSTYFPTTPTFNFQAFASLDKVKIVRGCQNLRAVCIPNIIQQGTAFSTAGVATPAISSVVYKPWLSTTAANVHFFTWQWSRQTGANSNGVEYNCYVKAYVEFRDRLSPGFNA